MTHFMMLPHYFKYGAHEFPLNTCGTDGVIPPALTRMATWFLPANRAIVTASNTKATPFRIAERPEYGSGHT